MPPGNLTVNFNREVWGDTGNYLEAACKSGDECLMQLGGTDLRGGRRVTTPKEPGGRLCSFRVKGCLPGQWVARRGRNLRRRGFVRGGALVRAGRVIQDCVTDNPARIVLARVESLPVDVFEVRAEFIAELILGASGHTAHFPDQLAELRSIFRQFVWTQHQGADDEQDK